MCHKRDREVRRHTSIRGRAQREEDGVSPNIATRPVSWPPVGGFSCAVAIALALLVLSCSAAVSTLQTGAQQPRTVTREWSTTVMLHGKPLELHLAAPRTPTADHVVVLYASGDGGWFGAAVDMFHQVARAGYYAVGFSSRAFLKIERPRGSLVTAAQLAAEYEQILAQARSALALEATTRVVLTGWSRGAAFAVLVGSESAAQDDLLGVIGIGLAEGEDLAFNGSDDETDDGPASPGKRRWPFENYARIARLGPLPCAVIQATRDNYLPAAGARQLFGLDTPMRRFYAVEARNHRFSGGKMAFDAALLDALHWIVAQPVRPVRGGAP